MEMNQVATIWTIFLALATCIRGARSEETGGEFDLVMPDIALNQKDIRLCHGVALNTNRTMFITGFVPQVNAKIVHHIIVYGCSKPGSNKDTWTCSEIHVEDVCRGAHMTIFMLADGLSELKLPDGVGFRVGGDTEFPYLVIQIHYNNLDSLYNGVVDDSSVRVSFTFEPLPHAAAFLIVEVKGGVVQPGQEEHFEVACPIDDDITIHPFAFHTHTHQLGRVVSGYRVRGKKWTEIGRRSRLLPSVFVPASPVPLTKGDMLAARCTMFNFKNHTVKYGPTHEDEMCSFEIIYYADRLKTLSEEYFTSPGPSSYYWKLDKNLNVSKVPDDASIIPPPPNGPDPEQPKQLHHRRRGQLEQEKRRNILPVLRRMRVLA